MLGEQGEGPVVIEILGQADRPACRRRGRRLADRGHRSHRAALRWSIAYPVMTMAIMITMPR
jgi:hypothetical protein